ncbi:hypothetical protein [Gallaecimonas xiamenensis]|uniref:Uncharacterized protein n=1 Tax=Gallaecimonas xiamenensis 3-C-1 TaxID=745411 RepID=K2ILI0_9GAMM|nr:hypothetical protein [Gallaecimonas xiamenensis]EKE71001.1 hypothetical protein B3C1_13434 [Gallaecimonas xiamenensis 3-C-1]
MLSVSLSLRKLVWVMLFAQLGWLGLCEASAETGLDGYNHSQVQDPSALVPDLDPPLLPVSPQGTCNVLAWHPQGVQTPAVVTAKRRYLPPPRASPHY